LNKVPLYIYCLCRWEISGLLEQ